MKQIIFLCFSFPLFLLCSCWDGWNFSSEDIKEIKSLGKKKSEKGEILVPVRNDDRNVGNKDASY